MRCPNCNKIIEEDFNYCPYCETDLSVQKYNLRSSYIGRSQIEKIPKHLSQPRKKLSTLSKVRLTFGIMAIIGIIMLIVGLSLVSGVRSHMYWETEEEMIFQYALVRNLSVTGVILIGIPIIYAICEKGCRNIK